MTRSKQQCLCCPEPPVEFTKPLEDQTVEEEATATLECEVSRENAEVRWFRDGQEIRKTKKYDTTSDGRKRALIIHDCSPDDAKMYTCDAKEFKTSCFLEVTRKSPTNCFTPPVPSAVPTFSARQLYWAFYNPLNPRQSFGILTLSSSTEEKLKFLEPIEDVETQEKKTISFVCKVNRPEVTVRWMKAGQEVTLSKRIVYRADGLKHTLNIKDCVMDDEGEYTAMVGDDKCAAELIISEAPTDFTAQLKDQTITEFEDAEFTCKLSKEKAVVKWYRNGREIREGPRYHVQISSMEARLFVEETPVEIVRPPQDAFEPPGSDIVFEVELNKDRVEVKWMRNNMIIVQGDKYQMISEGKVHRLQVCEIRPRDQGEYRIVAKDKDARAKLELAGESIKTTDQNLVTDAGKPFVMSVPYDAYPRAEAEWFFVGTSLPVQNIDTSADKTEYRLKSPSKEDQGRYKVVIKNKHGEGEAFINLDVIDVPGPVKNLRVVDTADGEVSLPPKFDGGSEITAYVIELRDRTSVKWEAAMVCGASDRSAALNDVVENKEYIFRVRAENKAGIGRPSAATNPRPSPPLNLNFSDQIKTAVTLSWETPVSNGGSMITGYIIEKCDDGSDKWLRCNARLCPDLSYRVRRKNPCCSSGKYLYRVCAENAAGVSDPAEQLGPLLADDPHGTRQTVGSTVESKTFLPLTIRVPITGYPTPAAKWTFGEKELTTADERVSMMTKSSFTELIITPSVRPDKGTYTLQLENDVTSVCIQFIGKLNVFGDFILPACPSAPKDFKVAEVTRHHVHLMWEAPEHDGGSPVTHYQIEKREVSRKTWAKVSLMTRLNINSKPPEIQLDVKLLAGLTARAGTKIELDADVKGKPDPRVKWTKADLVLRADDRITIDTQPGHSKLSIGNTTRGDTATYIIEAVNTCGRATATIDVNILGTDWIYRSVNKSTHISVNFFLVFCFLSFTLVHNRITGLTTNQMSLQ
uniref:Immunoglobulin I-set domain protein n=1 Tax=Stegastes partitus TaxID=144197 RepID=A0A3B5A7L2_9TELE